MNPRERVAAASSRYPHDAAPRLIAVAHSHPSGVGRCSPALYDCGTIKSPFRLPNGWARSRLSGKCWIGVFREDREELRGSA